jgi:hypothetical protein
MPELHLSVESAEAVKFAAAPLLTFKVRISNAPAEEVIHAGVLRAQIQLEVARRAYSAGEQGRLRDLFGTPDRWGQTLRSLLWTHANLMVPRFVGRTIAELYVPCTFDFNVAATKYFHGLSSGDLPLCFQFSGTVFYEDKDGALQVSPIPWDKEAKFRLPLKVWKDLMDEHYPNSAWLALRRDTFERLYEFKTREGIPTWEDAIERALASVRETVRS